jgi:GTP:adenosylcobinamide-phosphate guanylyltransferase
VTTAVVLAGGPSDQVAKTQPGAVNKGFVRIGGLTMVERVLLALKNSGAIERIIVVAPPAMHADAALRAADECRQDGAEITVSLRSGLRNLPPDVSVLVTASDLPLLSSVAIDDFLARAAALDADIGYECIERSVHVARYPTVPHTWAHLRDGTFCGGGLITIKPRVLPHLERFLERLGAARKNPLRLASLFGWDILVLLALRRLSVVQAQQRASDLLGAPVRAIVSPFPESGVNVDRVSDVALAEELVQAQSGRRTPAFE